MHIFWPNMIGGLVLVLVGVLIIIYRGPITRASVKGQTSFFGKSVGRAMDRGTSPAWTGVAGVVGILAGVASIIFAFFRH